VSLALYRTYRPGRLSEVIGQEHVTEPLARALDNDRVHHAYLFSGPRGCGKTSTARILARSLNCVQGPTSQPCGECTSCIELAPNGPGSLDVIELDAASHGRVDDTRDLRERAMFSPVSSRYKIYIVDEAHMVTPAGFNALLKLVEEPPEHVRFIFATTEVDKVLPTIRSRTHNYAFRLVSMRVLQAHLAQVCETEGVTAEPAALALIARIGGGSVRDSLSVLGQVIAGAAGDITYAAAVHQLGVTDVALVDATIEALADSNGSALFTVVDQVVDAGHDPRRFATDILQRLRDLIVLVSMPADDAVRLIDAPESEIEAMRAQALRFDLARLSRSADLVSAALTDLRGATAPRLHLELLAARLLLPALEQQAPVVRPAVTQEAPAKPVPAKPEPAKPAPSKSAPPKPAEPPAAAPRSTAPTRPAPTPPPPLSAVAPTTAKDDTGVATETSQPAVADSGSLSLQDVRTMWPAVLESLFGEKRSVWMAFSDSVPLSLEAGVLAVGLADVGKFNHVRGSGNDALLRNAVRSVLHVDLAVDVVLTDRSAATSDATTGAPTTAHPTPNADDTPSLDDQDADGDELTGESLAMAELGATVIGEIEQG
jgi:DNA polymerase-3 subunit gamma/tau